MDGVNIPLLRKAVEWAEAEALKPPQTSEWDQAHWRKVSGCGTSYCIAGWTCHANGDVWYDKARSIVIPTSSDRAWMSVSDRARELLGLTEDDADDLFDGGNTIEDVRSIAERLAGERL